MVINRKQRQGVDLESKRKGYIECWGKYNWVVEEDGQLC